MLDPARAAIGLQAPGLDGEQPTTDHLEELAERYVQEVRLEQSSGPYLLAGWSAGGVIALEMARQLSGSGHEVAALAVIDPTPLVVLPTVDKAGARCLFVEDLAHSAGRTVPPMGEVADPGLDDEEVIRRLRSLVVGGGLLPPEATAAFVAHRFAVFHSNLNAVTGYLPEPWGGRITYLQAADGDDVSETWRPFCATGMDRMPIPGDHYSMWSSGALPQLAATLDRAADAGLRRWAG